MELRDKIAEVIIENRVVDDWSHPMPSDYELADAIIVALPGISASIVRETAMREALKPFADYAKLSGFQRISDDCPLTKGSSMAARQVTALDFRMALAVLGANP